MSATSYIAASDLRDGALRPHISVGTADATDARLLTMGTAASALVDTYCNDHFHATTGGTVVVTGSGRAFQPLPKRVRGITTVTCIDYADNETAFDSTYWRIYTSFDNVSGSNVYQSPSGTDGLKLRKGLTVGQNGYWPTEPWVIEVVGNFDWATTPEEVKEATALIVWSWCITDVPPNVESVDTATARFSRPRPGTDTTGVIEADLLLQRFRRTQFGSLVRT